MTSRTFTLSFLAVLLLLCLGSTAGFSTSSNLHSSPNRGVALQASPSSSSSSSPASDQHRNSASKSKPHKVALSFAAAAYLFANVAYAPPADALDFGSSETIAARSGGRAGGRSSSGGYRGGGGGGGGRSSFSGGGASRSSFSGGGGYGGGAAASRAYSPTYRSTTIVRPMIAPSPFGYGGGYGGGFGYSPFSGIGLGYGLGAMGNNNRGDQAREYQQEKDIISEKSELEQTKLRAAELELRIKALEGSSGKALEETGTTSAKVLQEQTK
jgi:hypothetical protein